MHSVCALSSWDLLDLGLVPSVIKPLGNDATSSALITREQTTVETIASMFKHLVGSCESCDTVRALLRVSKVCGCARGYLSNTHRSVQKGPNMKWVKVNSRLL